MHPVAIIGSMLRSESSDRKLQKWKLYLGSKLNINIWLDKVWDGNSTILILALTVSIRYSWMKGGGSLIDNGIMGTY